MAFVAQFRNVVDSEGLSSTKSIFLRQVITSSSNSLIMPSHLPSLPRDPYPLVGTILYLNPTIFAMLSAKSTTKPLY